MPSVRGGSELTGFSLRNRAVDELFRSDDGTSGLLGARNWKNSYSAMGSSVSKGDWQNQNVHA